MEELSLKGSKYIFSKVLFEVIDSFSCATNKVSLCKMTSTSMDMALAEAASQKEDVVDNHCDYVFEIPVLWSQEIKK